MSEALAHVARLYYERDLTKQEIARRLGVSRFKVARLLDQAREEGVVRFTIADRVPLEDGLAQRLEQRYRLDLALVVPTAELARSAAGLLPSLLDDGDVVGVAWGSTLVNVAAALEPVRRELDVVQICGALPDLVPGTGPTEVALRFTERLGGILHALPAPAFSSRAARDELLAHEAIRPTVELFDAVTVALVGIGPHPAGGHVLVHAFDRDGVLADSDLSDRAIALSLLPPRHSRVVAVAGGDEKSDAVRGALCAGLVDVLVTDVRCAEAALG